jgi:HK97 family phage portal protein
VSLLFRGERRSINSLAWIRGADAAGWATKSGEPVGWSNVIGLDVVAAVVGLLSDVVFMLPLHTFRDVGGVSTRTQTPPLIASPSTAGVDARSWRAQAVVSWMLWGNAYGLITGRDSNQRVTSLDWVDPARVSVIEPMGILGPVTYFLNGSEMPPDSMLHLPGRYVRTGYRQGLVPLERFRETFGLALAARDYGSRWFGEGAHPSAVLETSNPIDAEQAKTIKDRFIAAIRGRREPAVLGGGMPSQSIQGNPATSELTQVQTHAAVAVARALGLLQPEMIGAAISGSSVTYANREQRAIDFLTFSADPYLVRLEDALTALLPAQQGGGPAMSGQYAKFNRGALLRTDLMTRYSAHDTAIRGGWRTPNEARVIEDEPPFPDGGDEHLWPPYAVTGVPIPPEEGPAPTPGVTP